MSFKKRGWFWIILFLSVIITVIFFTFPIKGHIPVLMYHLILPKSEVGTSSLHVSIENFERQMWFLKFFGFRAISLDEFYAIKIGQAEPRGREVLVTFDDGHRSYLQYALPIMERYGIQSANFLIWDHLNDDFWRDYMKLEEAKSISKHPLVTLGSHTLTHPDLVEINPTQARIEIVESKKKLEDFFGQSFDYLCYPSGTFNDYVVESVREAGYRLAFTTARKRLNGERETLYSIARLKIGLKDNLFAFWLNVSGIMDYEKRIDLFFHQLTANRVNGKLNVYKPVYETT